VEQNNIESSLNISDINSAFEQVISLNRLIGNRAVVEQLNILVEQYFHDHQLNKALPYPAILIIGGKNSGRRTLARAICNSFCLPYRETISKCLCMGGDSLDEFFLAGKEMCYHVSEAQDLSNYTQQAIHRLIYDKQLTVSSPIEKHSYTYPFRGLLILSALETNNLAPQIIKDCTAVCRIKEYSIEERKAIVSQRFEFLGLKYDKEVLDALTQIVDIAIIMKSTELAYKVMATYGDTKITSKHLKKAIHLLAASGYLA